MKRLILLLALLLVPQNANAITLKMAHNKREDVSLYKTYKNSYKHQTTRQPVGLPAYENPHYPHELPNGDLPSDKHIWKPGQKYQINSITYTYIGNGVFQNKTQKYYYDPQIREMKIK